MSQITEDIQFASDTTMQYRATAERVLQDNSPDLATIHHSLNGWLAAAALIPSGATNSLLCLVNSIYAMGYERGKKAATMPKFIVAEDDTQEEEGL